MDSRPPSLSGQPDTRSYSLCQDAIEKPKSQSIRLAKTHKVRSKRPQEAQRLPKTQNPPQEGSKKYVP
eukprot:4829236-Karenia_brevis.AAC.1